MGERVPRSDDHRNVVKRIMDEMLDGTWRTGKSHRAYADEYGVEVCTVRRWSSEAYMFIRLCQGSEDDIRGRILAGIDLVCEKALQRKFIVTRKDGEVAEYPSPDVKSYLTALEFYARVYGVDKPKESTNESVTEAELAELLRARGYSVEPPAKTEPETVEHDDT